MTDFVREKGDLTVASCVFLHMRPRTYIIYTDCPEMPACSRTVGMLRSQDFWDTQARCSPTNAPISEINASEGATVSARERITSVFPSPSSRCK